MVVRGRFFLFPVDTRTRITSFSVITGFIQKMARKKNDINRLYTMEDNTSCIEIGKSLRAPSFDLFYFLRRFTPILKQQSLIFRIRAKNVINNNCTIVYAYMTPLLNLLDLSIRTTITEKHASF